MPAFTYLAEETGARFQITTLPTEREGVMSLAISRPEGRQIALGEIEPRELSRARFTGRVMQFAGNARVQYRVVTNGIAARIGFLFGFDDGGESHSVLVEHDCLDWLLGR